MRAASQLVFSASLNLFYLLLCKGLTRFFQESMTSVM
jgi:hypothetical protein